MTQYLILLPVQCNAWHWIEYKITSTRTSGVHPSAVCGQDCDVIYGPILTNFGTHCYGEEKNFPESPAWAWSRSCDQICKFTPRSSAPINNRALKF